MLKHLSIQHYALISDLDIEFDAGFSVLTGETGAGKSIILGALGLLMGARADIGAISEGEQKCTIEGDFDISAYQMEAFFEENELDYSPICTIRRELHVSGKSRSFINDSPVTLAILKPLAARLIDIHSQHENLLLSDTGFCQSVIDTLARNEKEREQYSLAYQTYRQTEKELQDLKKEAEASTKNADYMRYRLEQLEEAKIEDGELSNLEEEHERLAHAEEICEHLTEGLHWLRDDDGDGVVQSLKNTLRTLEHVRSYLPEEEHITERIESAYLDMRDLADTTERLIEETEANPRRLEEIEERIGLIQTLLRNFDAETEADLLAIETDYRRRLERTDSYDFDIQQLSAKLEREYAALKKAAEQLTLSRRKVEPKLKKELEEMLGALGVAHAQIALGLEALADYDESGADLITILFAANLGQKPRPVAEVASGGEMARLMLSIKALIADTQGLPTIIFDEVDTGVSGEVARQMGKIMQRIATGRQVIAITHLPQIAAQGKLHYMVYKQDAATRTETHIRLLTEAEREQEIGKLLSGSDVTPEAIANAKRLLGMY